MDCPDVNKDIPENPAPADKLRWSVLGDGTVSIEKFTGDDESFVIPAEIDGKRVTKIGAGAFCKSIFLKSVKILDSVTKIGSNAFKECELLAMLKFPDGVIPDTDDDDEEPPIIKKLIR